MIEEAAKQATTCGLASDVEAKPEEEEDRKESLTVRVSLFIILKRRVGVGTVSHASTEAPRTRSLGGAQGPGASSVENTHTHTHTHNSYY